MKVKVQMNSVSQILKEHGLDRDGYAQMHWTKIVNSRISRYMPYRSGALTSKLKTIYAPAPGEKQYISGAAEITVDGPYAQYQYYGKVMIDPNINAAGFPTKDGTWRSRLHSHKVRTERDIQYDTTKNAQAGPLWDRRLIAAEGPAMLEEMRVYIRKREGKR